MIALCYWVFSPSETRFTVIPLVFALGRLTLLDKGVFLLRNSSEGSVSRNRNSPSSPTLLFARPFRRFLPKPLKLFRISAQVPYSFGHFSCSVKIYNSWSDPPRFRVFLAAAIIFSLGWVIRQLTSSPTAQGCVRPAFAPFHFDDYALYQDLRAFRPLIASYCSGRGTPWKNGAVFYCCACLPGATNPRSAGRCQSGWRRRCISIFGTSTEPEIFCRILMRFAFPLISPDK
jgi:hypothetical protein